MLEDEMTTLLSNVDEGSLDKIKSAADSIGQDLQNTGATPSNTSDPEALRAAGWVFNGYGWSKP